MKEVVKVSIAGLAFDLDKAAYEELDTYLARLAEGYRGNPDGPEIIADIEARVVELILSQQGAGTVVAEPLVHSVVGQLGMPDDFGEATPDAGKYATQPASERFPKRLYRNPEGAKIGGVCSGLGTYLGVDPVWIRVGIFVPLLLVIISAVLGLNGAPAFMACLFSTFVLLYFILWIAVPLAKTPRQLLEMRGEKITASSIEAAAQDYPREKIYRSASGADSAMSALGRIIVFCLKAFLFLIGIGMAFAAIGLIIAMFSVPWIDSWTYGTMLLPFSGIHGISAVGMVTLVLAAIAIPIIMIVYGIICLVFSRRVNRAVMWILGAAWLIIVIFAGVTVVRNSHRILDNITYSVPGETDLRLPAVPPAQRQIFEKL